MSVGRGTRILKHACSVCPSSWQNEKVRSKLFLSCKLPHTVTLSFPILSKCSPSLVQFVCVPMSVEARHDTVVGIQVLATFGGLRVPKSGIQPRPILSKRSPPFHFCPSKAQVGIHVFDTIRGLRVSQIPASSHVPFCPSPLPSPVQAVTKPPPFLTKPPPMQC